MFPTSSSSIKIVPLGAGQDVGRSCVLVSMNGKNIMFDCGMHMGYYDERRFPDFSYISKSGHFNEIIDAVIISHFHLDHCGALPYFTEICGYDGPIYMTYPTKAICPILLEDMRRVAVERKGETNFFTSDDIKNCMKKVIPVDIHETFKLGLDIEIKAYYAGHVLGAGMFHVKVGNQSVVYTGDYNMTPDRHLGAAWIDKCRPDVLITETTYGTTIRDSKRARERDFLRKVHDCVIKGGKVLIPVFALGRAQELCILIEGYWERMNLDVPVFFSAGLTERANEYYKLFINWTNEKIKKTFVERNMFDFKHIRSFESSFAGDPGAMVLFATPGMLHAGTSLEVFKKWCHDEKNMVILPGYCVAGTVGAKVLAGEKLIEIDRFTRVHVNMAVENLSFSAHADAKGVMQLIRMCEPKNVILVHGEKSVMAFLKTRIIREMGIPAFDPANGATVTLDTDMSVPLDISASLVRKAYEAAKQRQLESLGIDQVVGGRSPSTTTTTSSTIIKDTSNRTTDTTYNTNHLSCVVDLKKVKPITQFPIHGIAELDLNEKRVRLIDATIGRGLELAQDLQARISSSASRKSYKRTYNPSLIYFRHLKKVSEMDLHEDPMHDLSSKAMNAAYEAVVQYLGGGGGIVAVEMEKLVLSINAGAVTVSHAPMPENAFIVTWSVTEKLLASRVLTVLNKTF